MVKKPNYTAKEKRLYQARKKEEKPAKKAAGPRQEIMHRVWADAHTGIDQKEIDKPKSKKQGTCCTWTNHGWKHCTKEIRISTIQRREFKLRVGRSKPPRPGNPRLAAVADDSRGESLQQASVTHRAPERMREPSYPTLVHEPPEKSDATPPSSPDVGTIGHQQSPGKLRPHNHIRHQEHPTCNIVYVAAVGATGSGSQDI